MKRIILKPGEEDRILGGHPWVYGNEVEKILAPKGPGPLRPDPRGPAELSPGELAEVEGSVRGRPVYLGRAFVNPQSKIIARIVSPSKEGVDKGFFKRRIRESIARRNLYDLTKESARIVFAEADFLPGLTVDRFVGWPVSAVLAEGRLEGQLTHEAVTAALGNPRSWLGVQFLIWAMDARREEILTALEETLGAPLGPGETALGVPEGIVEKSAAKVREAEGLPLREGLCRGTLRPRES